MKIVEQTEKIGMQPIGTVGYIASPGPTQCPVLVTGHENGLVRVLVLDDTQFILLIRRDALFEPAAEATLTVTRRQ